MTRARTRNSDRELVARALCSFHGHPDAAQLDGQPMWKSYLPEADAVLVAIEAASSAVLEYVPIEVYHLLRKLAQGPIDMRALHGVGDKGAVAFLLSRGLAESEGEELLITPDGARIGEIKDERH